MVIQEAFAHGVPVATSFTPNFHIPYYQDCIFQLPEVPTSNSIVRVILASFNDSISYSRMSLKAKLVSQNSFDSRINNKFMLEKIISILPP